MNKLNVTEFKAQCLSYIKKVSKTGGELVITKRGVPVAKLTAYEQPKRPSIFGCMKGRVKIVGDITGPTDIEWNALKDKDDSY